MKQLITTALLGLFSFNAAHAQNCKYVKEESDPFNHKTAHTGYLTVGPMLAGWEVILQKIDAQYYLGLRVMFGGTINKLYKRGDKVLFKFSNDEVIELIASQDYKPIPTTFLNSPYTEWIVKEAISAETFKKLTTANITNIKTNIEGNEYLVPKITEKQTDKIIETAKCLIEK